MALRRTLEKENNYIGMEINDAYWKVENINIGNHNGRDLVRFDLNCYANRDASNIKPHVLKSSLSFGEAMTGGWFAILYSWHAEFNLSTIFKEYVPNNLSDQKAIIYNFIKDYLAEKFIDC